MDDIQFNASLDALLANETLDGTTGVGDTTINVPQSGASASAPESYAPGVSRGVTACSAAFSSNGVPQGQGMNSAYTITAPMQFGATKTALGQAVATAAGTIVPNQQVPLPSAAASTGTLGSYVSHGSYETGNNSSGRFTGNRKHTSGTKRSRGGDKDGSAAVSDDEDDKDKRRQDRNLREQQRSHRITAQIEELRTILSSAQVRHKPDKFSTLVTIGDYIKQLQQRSAMLDAEHKKLIDTISRTNELANEPHLPDGAVSRSCSSGPEALTSISGQSGPGVSDIYNEDELVFVRNVDYQSIFFKCGIPLAVASIDGRFLDCNVEFENVSGYKRGELLPNNHLLPSSVPDPMSSMSSKEERHSFDLEEVGNSESPELPLSSISGPAKSLSLFNLLSRDCMEGVFLALSAMLKRPSKNAPQIENEADRKDFWTGNVRLNRNTKIEVRFSRVPLEAYCLHWSVLLTS